MTSSIVRVEGRDFHPIWLRDNCLCEQCQHPGSHQKIFDISEMKQPPRIVEQEIDGEALRIVWDESPPHESRFSLAWLARQAERVEPVTARSPRTLWTAATWRSAPPQWRDMPDALDGDESWQQDLLRFGVALFRKVNLETLTNFISAIGPIHHTEYGPFAHIRSIADANDISETGYALTPHVDYSTYMHTQALLQFMYFEVADSVGGETILVDGFKAANDFRRDYPEKFDILVNTYVEFQQLYRNWQYHFIRKRPVIELDSNDEVTGVFFGHSHCYNWNLPLSKTEAYYDAYGAFFRYLKSPHYQWVFKLEAGECVAVQNARILHGRNAFDPQTGHRHLVVGYVPWEFLVARMNFSANHADFISAKA